MCNRVCRTRDNARSRRRGNCGRGREHGLGPYPLDGDRCGYRMDNGEIHDSMLRNALGDAVLGEHSGWHTENLIKNAGFSREERDQWAAITTRFRRGITSGTFRRGNCQPLKEKSGDIRFDKDEPHGGIHPWRR
ncbi:hypothetical protein [Caballeronia mineralivorans]|uniref:thiolase family protein n=1 Tax=Caballeronia mineralivorans TaxID=2010198 RepID=UPI002AFEB34F|nr:hypothetical protein [Caballeronia mineralivorans]